MFEIPNAKSFMDSVHGYISIPKCFVKNLIDTLEFQRLRNIEQTGMRILYHNAKHDRFSHSLGVYYLGCKAVDSLLDNFSRDDYWNISSDNNSVIFWAKNKVLFLIACLLHDIGHAPFSHSLEDLVLKNSADEDILTERLVKIINEIENDSEVKEITSAPHEKIGALFILEQLRTNVENIYKELIGLGFPKEEFNNPSNILYAEHYDYNPVINMDDFDNDLCFIARMILGLKYKSFEPEKQIKNCFIELLNGNNFDVDKLDYIIRDTKMSGISNINIDIERLLGSVCIITKTKCLNKINLNINPDGVISYLKGNEDNSIVISGNFRGTFHFYDDAEIVIKENSSFICLNTNNQSKIKYAEEAEICKFDSKTKVIQNGEEVIKVSKDRNNKKTRSLPEENGSEFECCIENAVISPENEFHFITKTKKQPNSLVEMQVNGYCSLEIKGKYSIKSPITCFEKTHIEGNVKETTVLGNYIKTELPNKFSYNEFVVGFNKNAINVIANVLEARDYLYLWIYAHHKVIYYANFLTPIVSKKITSDPKREFPVWNLNYQDILYIDDAYIWTSVKNLIYKNILDGEPKKLCEELLNRKYKNSLYKSLAEYDLLFEEFTYEEKIKIKQYILSNYNKDLPYVASNQITACYLSDEVLDEVKNHKGLKNVTKIVYVDASYSTKKIDVNNTFIRFNYDKVATLSEIPLLADRISLVGSTNQYFYLYFETNSEDIKEISEEREILKNSIVNILKTKALQKN